MKTIRNISTARLVATQATRLALGDMSLRDYCRVTATPLPRRFTWFLLGYALGCIVGAAAAVLL